MSSNPDSPGHSSEDARDLFARIRGSDVTAFESLYLAYHERLWDFAASLVRSSSIAEELVQDVFLSIWTRRESISPPDSVDAFLFGAVRRSALRVMRHDRVVDRAAEWIDPESVVSRGDPASDDALIARDFEQAVNAAIADLSEARRTAITLRWRHGLSYPEIAAVLGSSVEAVTIQIARTRSALRKTLARFLD